MHSGIPYGFATSRKEAGAALVAFTQKLLDHQSNDTKTSEEEVQSSFEQWKAADRIVQEDDGYLQKIYEKEHQNPRMHAQAAYETLRHQQQMKRRAYLDTKHRDELYAWVEGKLEEEHFSGFMDTTYTKYVHGV